MAPNNKIYSPSEDEIDLLDVIAVLVNRWKTIAATTFSAFLAAVVIALLLPKIYAATASILPPQQDNISSPLSNLPSGLGSLAGGLINIKTPTDLWVGILKSQTVKDAIIGRFNLIDAYETETLDDVRKTLGNNVDIEKSNEDIISITVEDRDPERAAEMANAFVEELDRINRSGVMTAGGRMRAFVEKRLKEAEAELKKAEEAVKSFQEKNMAVKLDEQSRAIIGAIGTVKGQLMAKEVELQTLLSYATQGHPQAQILRAEVRGLGEKLRELEEGKKGTGNPSRKDIFIPTTKFPDLAIQYARLLRESKIQETLFEMLTQQYEMARIQEAKDTPTVQVLDKATVPQIKAKPRRTLIVLLATFTALIVSLFLVFVLEYIENAKKRGQAFQT